LVRPRQTSGRNIAHTDYSFTVHFPVEPKIEITTYQAPNDRSLSAVYSATQDTGVFKVTVARCRMTKRPRTFVATPGQYATEGGSVSSTSPTASPLLRPPAQLAGANGSYSYVAVSPTEAALSARGKAFVGGARRRSKPCAHQSLDFT
jgi:hypothetical protein